jgi:hypothetical protein
MCRTYFYSQPLRCRPLQPTGPRAESTHKRLPALCARSLFLVGIRASLQFDWRRVSTVFSRLFPFGAEGSCPFLSLYRMVGFSVKGRDFLSVFRSAGFLTRQTTKRRLSMIYNATTAMLKAIVDRIYTVHPITPSPISLAPLSRCLSAIPKLSDPDATHRVRSR